MDWFSFEHVKPPLHEWGGLLVGVVVGLESLGLPLPGEGVLLAAALYAGSTHDISIVSVVVCAAAGAIVGDNIGYLIGREIGERLLLRWGGRIGITAERLELFRRLFARYGAWVVLFGRFIALLRTLSALAAGVSRLRWPVFLAANGAGGIVWASLYGFGAYFLGDRVKEVRGPFGIGVAVAAAAGFVIAMLVVRRHQRRLLGEG